MVQTILTHLCQDKILHLCALKRSALNDLMAKFSLPARWNPVFLGVHDEKPLHHVCCLGIILGQLTFTAWNTGVSTPMAAVNVTSVPEPSAVVLVSLGVIALGIYRISRRSARLS